MALWRPQLAIRSCLNVPPLLLVTAFFKRPKYNRCICKVPIPWFMTGQVARHIPVFLLGGNPKHAENLDLCATPPRLFSQTGMRAIDSHVYPIVLFIDRQPLYSWTALVLSHDLCHTKTSVQMMLVSWAVDAPLYSPLIPWVKIWILRFDPAVP